MTLGNHTVRSIRSEAQYYLAIEHIRDIWEAEPNTPEGDRLDILMDLVELYESKKYQIGLPDPIAAIRIRMDDLELRPTDLAKQLGTSRGYISDILNRHRRLTLPVIQNLSSTLTIGLDVLAQSYDTSPR